MGSKTALYVIEALREQFSERPCKETLECLATQFELFAKKEEYSLIRAPLMRTVSSCSHVQELKNCDALLRLYCLAGRMSRNLGFIGVYESLSKEGRFKDSLKFHLQWAEAYAKANDIVNFKKTLELARERLSKTLDVVTIESGFRDLADTYCLENSEDLFLEADNTLVLFSHVPHQGSKENDRRKGRRRSSVLFLQRVAAPKDPILNDEPFGPGTHTLIRRELINRTDGYEGLSMEEFRAAQMSDEQDMDISVDEIAAQNAVLRRDSGIVKPLSAVNHSGQQKTMVITAYEADKENARRRKISAIDEEEEAADRKKATFEEKRPRFSSPVVPSKPKSSNSTITISSSTKSDGTIFLSSGPISSVKPDKTLNGCEESFLLDDLPTARSSKSTTATRTNTALEKSSAEEEHSSSTHSAQKNEAISFVENAYYNARALLSETVNLKNADEDDGTMQLKAESPKGLKDGESFEVLNDPDPSILCSSARPTIARSNSRGGLNVVFDEEEEPKFAEPALPGLKSKKMAAPARPFVEDDTIVQGSGNLNKGGKSRVCTSTPLDAKSFISAEEFFNIKSLKNSMETVQEDGDDDVLLLLPQSESAISRRLSLAPNRTISGSSQKNNDSQTKNKSASKNEKSQEGSVSDELEGAVRRLSIGKPVELQTRAEPFDPEVTGVKKKRRSEMVTGLNPWNADLRAKIMKLVRAPQHLHEFQTPCPKVMAMKEIDVSGEQILIQTLIGQGGYAKVYKGKLDDNSTVAVKYEVPSCAWEVFICDQAYLRLSKSADETLKKIAATSIMRVTDAYIYTNASLLVNEYHEFGTILDLTNKVHDPHWMHTLFIAIQMAKIIRAVHSCDIIHADIKPDNFVITKKIRSDLSAEDVLDDYVFKLIDWGRAIDMKTIGGHTFKGRAGTEAFDSPEMIDGRPWTYQSDYFGFVGTLIVVATGKYPELAGDKLGQYKLGPALKRRVAIRDMLDGIIREFINIESCDELPDWNATIRKMEEFWTKNFDAPEWRAAVNRFNAGATATH